MQKNETKKLNQKQTLHVQNDCGMKSLTRFFFTYNDKDSVHDTFLFYFVLFFLASCCIAEVLEFIWTCDVSCLTWVVAPKQNPDTHQT